MRRFRDRAETGRLERAIGVVYRPETERIVHVDETSAVEPLERTGVREEGELPGTYPWGV